MELPVFLAVLAAAAMHAGWNAMVRQHGGDPFTPVLALALGSAALAAMLLPFFPAPGPDGFRWLALSMVFHTGYLVFLVRAYEHGGLSQVYPLARGTAPVIVALIGAAFLGEALGGWRLASIALIAGGVLLMSRRGGAGLASMPREALRFALLTACCTAGYTLTDGMGARSSPSPHGFTVWLFLFDGLALLAWGLATRGVSAARAASALWRRGLVAGALSMGSYWVAIWAFTKAPIALVAALRESSVLFAMLFAVALGEKAGPWRWAAAALIFAGVAAMRL